MHRFTFVFILSILLFSIISFAEKPSPNPVKSKVEWMSFEEAVKRSENGEKRKIFIDVYTDWCGWCKRMDATTFNDPVVADYLNNEYYAVKLDAERKDTMMVNGTMYKFVPNGRRGYHELAAALLNGKMSYPTVVLLDEQFNMLQAIPGYRGAVDMDYILKYFGQNKHKQNVKFDEFKANYKSPVEQ